MFQTIITRGIINYTHFPEARERAQYIVEETEKARIKKMEEYARETTTTARRTALMPILKANEEAVRQAKEHAWDMECEERQVERWLQERLEKETEGELLRPWKGGPEATKNGWDRQEYAISVRDIRAEQEKGQPDSSTP